MTACVLLSATSLAGSLKCGFLVQRNLIPNFSLSPGCVGIFEKGVQKLIILIARDTFHFQCSPLRFRRLNMRLPTDFRIAISYQAPTKVCVYNFGSARSNLNMIFMSLFINRRSYFAHRHVTIFEHNTTTLLQELLNKETGH